MHTIGRSGTMARRGSAALLTLTLLAALLGATPRAARAQEAPDEPGGRLAITVLDESGLARGGACALVVDAAGSEQTVCDDDGDGTLLAEGPAAGWAAVKPVQPAAGCAGGFGGEVEIPEGGEAAVTLTDACEPLQPTEEAKETEPPIDEKPTEGPKPTEEPKETEPPMDPTETPEEKPSQESTPLPPATLTPTPAVAPMLMTGTLLIALTSATFGAPSLGACYEILDRATYATLATGCDGDDGATDGQTAFTNLPPGQVVVQQIAGDPLDNPADSRLARIADGKTTSVALVTMPLSDLEVVPVGENGQTITIAPRACYELRRYIAGVPARGVCVGPDGIARFPNVPWGAWSLVETAAPTDHELAQPLHVTVNAGADLTVSLPHLSIYRGSLSFDLVGADFGQPMLGGCVESDDWGVFCDGDDGVRDGRVTANGILAGDYYFGPFGTVVQNGGVYGPGRYQIINVHRANPQPTYVLAFERLYAELSIYAANVWSGVVAPGACYAVSRVAANGSRSVVASVCDDDSDGDALVILDQPGTYVVSVTRVPSGFGPAGELSIDILTDLSGGPGYNGLYRSFVFFRFGSLPFSLPS